MTTFLNSTIALSLMEIISINLNTYYNKSLLNYTEKQQGDSKSQDKLMNGL